MNKNINQWLEEVADQCHDYATKIDKDFYVFQTSIIENPDILIIGINPGSSGTYSEYLKNNNVQKRKATSLYYAQNLLVEPASDWEDSMGLIRIKFKEIFHNDYLFQKLKNSVMMNAIYFNTTGSEDLKEIDNEILEYCITKTKEFIKIINPKQILIFSSDKNLLVKIGVQNIQQSARLIKTGTLSDVNVIAIPHFSARGYNSTAIRNEIGQDIEKIIN